MKKAAVLLGGVLAVALFLGTFVTHTFAENKTVTGKLVDLSCYGQDKDNTGNVHKGKGYNCGKACAREGFPVGLLTSDGKVYQITGDLAAHANAKLVPHIAENATITGDVMEKGGITMITASDLK
jgi:hypothetical protein